MSMPLLPYGLPLALYLGGVSLLGFIPRHYAAGYIGVTLLAAAGTAAVLRGRGIVRPHGRVGAGVAIGLLGIALWIALAELGLERQLASWLPKFLQPGERPGFNPWEALPSVAARWAFIVVRMLGLVVLVPLAEELFWRGFLWRWIQNPNWTEVPLGQWHWPSLVGVTLCFTAVHPEWLAAAVYGTLVGLLWVWQRDLWQCVVAHATSNLVLGIYILATRSWHLW